MEETITKVLFWLNIKADEVSHYLLWQYLLFAIIGLDDVTLFSQSLDVGVRMTPWFFSGSSTDL